MHSISSVWLVTSIQGEYTEESWTRCLLVLAVNIPKLIWSVTPLYTLLPFLKIKFVHRAWKKSKNTVESLTTITSRIRQLFTKPEMTAAAHETYYWKRFFGKWDLSVANYYLGSFFKSRQKTDKFWRFLVFFSYYYDNIPGKSCPENQG